MNKGELITRVSEKTNCTKASVAEIINAAIGETVDELAGGGNLQIVGFGTFSTVKRAARTGHNPQTGKEIKIAAKNAPKFKAGKELKDRVASGKKAKKK